MENHYPNCDHTGLFMINERGLLRHVCLTGSLRDNRIYSHYLDDAKIQAIKEARDMVKAATGQYASLKASKDFVEEMFGIWDESVFTVSAAGQKRNAGHARTAKIESVRDLVARKGGFVTIAEVEAIFDLLGL